MLSQVAKLDADKKPIVFLGWEPHPMNANFKLTYLTGGDDVFGPNLGGATIYTNTRPAMWPNAPMSAPSSRTSSSAWPWKTR